MSNSQHQFIKLHQVIKYTKSCCDDVVLKQKAKGVTAHTAETFFTRNSRNSRKTEEETAETAEQQKQQKQQKQQ